MEAYTSFARVYDMFMDNIPYQEWCRYLTEALAQYKICDGLILDLGCGTGSMTELLAREGYDMIGVDNSPEMLEIAMEKQQASGLDILYLLQDMEEFELYGTVRAVISVCDSFNYLPDYEALLQTFRQINNYLDPGGILIFDLNTEYKYRVVLADKTIAENRLEGSFIWDNYFDEESRINEYELALFIPENEGGFKEAYPGGQPYRKYQETHYQRAFSLEEVFSALKESGMELLGCYEAFTKDDPKPDSQRVSVIAKEKGKSGNEKETDCNGKF